MTGLGRDEVLHALPYARRYARALTGSQAEGDRVVAECLRTLVDTQTGSQPEATGLLPDTARRQLYRAITARLSGLGDPEGAQPGLAGLSMRQRQLLLLTTLEEVPVEDAAGLTAMPLPQAAALLAEARDRLRAAAATDVLIIEDEPIIAMDIEELVISCGHRVIGVAATETDAVDIARREKPGLILADINLGVGGDGTNAVARILRHLDAPVIFVTAYPERLLTGEAVEPAFVITKPFEPLTLAIATYQAVTGGLRLE